MASSISRTNDNWKDKSPTDDELGKVLDEIPLWFQLAVALGVPIAQAEAYEKKPSHIGGLYALRYWRDGRCNETKFPPTWRFLFETAGTVCGSQVAKQLEAIVSPVQTQLVGPHGGGTKSESSSNTLRQRIVPTPQSPEPLNTGTPSPIDGAENSAEEKECPIHDKTGRSGGNIPPRTVRPSSHKTTRVVIVVIVLGISIVSASSHTSCDQLSFCPNHYLCPTRQYYREPISDSMRSTSTRIMDIIRDSFQSTPQEDMYTSSHTSVSSQEPLNTPSPIGETEDNAKEKEHPIDDKTDIDEESLKISQPQTEAKTSSTPTLTRSGIPRPSNAPPDEGKDEGTSKIPLENLDNLTWHNLTEEDLSLLQGHTVKEGDYVWMMLGITGAGKSCLGNFIFQEDNRFPEASVPLKSMTQNASIGCKVFDTQRLCIVDTPGLGDTKRIGTHESKAMDVANDASHLIIELTKMMMLTRTGISAFFIMVPLHHKDYAGLQQLLHFFDILGNFWNHSIVVLTHGTVIGGTEDEQYKMFTDLLQDPDCPPILIDLVKKVNDHFVIVEAKDWRSDTAYRNGVVTKLLSLSDDIIKQHDRYQDNLQSIGREAYEKAKLQYRNEFEDIDSPEAKEAIFRSTFSYVREAVLKLVRIKLADGEDVDKLKEMNKLKEKMLEEIRKQRDQLHQEYLEEQKRRREAEEEQKRIEEERRKEEQKRKQAEEEQRKADERRRLAEEQKLKEQREKEEAQKKLEEYLKKPTFNERRIKVEVTDGNFYRWKWVYSAKAVDVATGISAEAQNYASKGGAKEHAREDLKAILLDRGIIRKDNI